MRRHSVSQSITTRLILAFFLVGIVVVALASGITYWLTVREFRQLTYDQARDRFVADMSYYYETQGSWAGVLTYYEQRTTATSHFTADRPPPGPDSGPGQGPPQTLFFALADEQGRIVIPAGQFAVGDQIAPTELATGTAITVNEARVGTALVIGSPPPLGGLEQRYLSRTNLALIYAAVGGMTLALVLAIVLARALSRPIRELTGAIRSMGSGNLRQEVQIRSTDELGELATAFNQMSADLDRLTRARRRMTADIAHDLRNPLTVIGGYIESMREGVLESTPGRLEVVLAEVRHLERLVEDLRTLSQAEAGELTLNREPVPPARLLHRMQEAYRPLAEKQGVHLGLEAGAELPEVHADPDRLAQVLGNLISNSLRYTPTEGEIMLSARATPTMLILEVRDNGKGIDAAALPHIFDRFYRADSARTNPEESGLGLAIARSIIAAHGGTITASSRPGAGTTMTIELPREPQAGRP